MGASGAGVTTLGRALADTLGLSHHDVDDYYWLPTNPPYQEKRTVADRLRLMREIFLDREGWILSGSLDGWVHLSFLFSMPWYLCSPHRGSPEAVTRS
jgi:adenylate kinase family enzyme